MFPAKLAVLFTALCFSVFFNLVFIKEVSGDAMPSTANCVTCLTCQYPCTPGGGYPLYPPPPPSQTSSPPPPTPPQQPKCPPGQPSQYPTPPGQYPLYPSPPGTIGGGGYVPYPYNSASSSPLSILLSVLVMLLFSSAVFF